MDETVPEGTGPEQEGEARGGGERYYRGRDFGPAPLPFQFQIPLGGGGGPGLAFPIGGYGSPLAFTVPLGGTPAAVPVLPAAVAIPTVPASSTPSSPSAYTPVTTAAADAPLYVPPAEVSAESEMLGEQVLAAAEAFGRSGAVPRSSSAFIESL